MRHRITAAFLGSGAEQRDSPPGSPSPDPIPHKLLLWNVLGLIVIALCLAGIGSLLSRVSNYRAVSPVALPAMGLTLAAIVWLGNATGGRIIKNGLETRKVLVVLEGAIALVANLALGGYMLLMFLASLYFTSGAAD